MCSQIQLICQPIILSFRNTPRDQSAEGEGTNRIPLSAIPYFSAGQTTKLDGTDDIYAPKFRSLPLVIHRPPKLVYDQTDLFDKHKDINLRVIIYVLKSDLWFSLSLCIECEYVSMKWKLFIVIIVIFF